MSSQRYCPKCGTPLAEGAAFCHSCGAPAVGASAPPAQSVATRHEKQEKGEKREKREKSEKGEKRGDRNGPVIGGLILIWLGVTFYLAQAGTVSWTNWWAYFLLGLGAIIIGQGVLRLAGGRGPYVGSFIGGAVLMLIGYASVQPLAVELWPLILMVIGAGVILSGVAGRRRVPKP